MRAVCSVDCFLRLPHCGIWLVVVLGLGHAAITPAAAGTIYWNMQTLAATSNDVTGLVAGDLTRGQGGGTSVTGTASSSSAGYTFLLGGTATPASGGNNGQSSALGGPLVTGSSAYFAISLSNTSSKALSVVSIGFGARSTASGPAAYALRSSLDGYATDIAGGTGAIPTTSTWAFYTTSFPAPVEIVAGGGIQFRLFGYGGTAVNLNNLTWRIDDLQVVVVPEPAAAGFSVLLAAGLGVTLRRARNATVRFAAVQATVVNVNPSWTKSTRTVLPSENFPESSSRASSF